MATLLLLGYAAICVVIFKLLRVPFNKWSITTVAIGGVGLVGGLLIGMNYNHPYTSDGRFYFYTTPIIPTVKGAVVEVTAKPNTPLKQGDVLFRIDPAPNQYIVDQKRAALAEAKQNVKQLQASLDKATAGVDKMRAQVALAQHNYERQEQLFERKVIAQATLDTAERNVEAARQSLAGAEAAQEQAQLAHSSNVDGINTTVARLQADLKNAEYDLGQTAVTAPTDGYVTQMILHPGMTVSPSTPTMVFIHTDDVIFFASFAQNNISRVKVGSEAEAAFAAVPGRVFSGKVAIFHEGIAQGQLQASGILITPEERSKSDGRALVRIDLTDNLGDYHIPPGSLAEVAVYSDHWRAIAVMRRIMLRMKSWMNYVL